MSEDKCLCCGKCCYSPNGVRCPMLSNLNRCKIYNNRLMYQFDGCYCWLREEQGRFIEGCPYNSEQKV